MSDSEEDHKPDFGERNDDDIEVKPSDDPPADNSDDEQEKRKKRGGDVLSDESDDENEKRKRRRSDSLSQRDVVNEREEAEEVGVQALVLKPNQKKDAPEGGLARKSTKTNRNAKFMGNLLGHLGKAKKNLEKEREGDKRRCQEEVEERVFNKLREERKIIAEKRAKDEEARRLQAKQMQLLHQRLVKHYSTMRHFIRTKTEPAIFFLPKKHNSVTLQLLQETRDDIDRKLEMLKEDLSADDPYFGGDFRNSTQNTGWKKGYGYGSGQIAGSRDIAAEGKQRFKRERSV